MPFRIHFIGVGSIGSLVAFHLRRVHEAPRTRMSLIVRRWRFRRSIQEDLPASIVVEKEGIRRKVSGFAVEVASNSKKLAALHAPSTPPSILLPRLRMRVTETGEEQQGPPHTHIIESLIVTTKTGTTRSAIESIRHRLDATSTIVLLQNGMGTYEHLVNKFFQDPDTRPNFILASTTHGVWRKGPLDIVHAGAGSLHFGIIPDPFSRRNFERSLENPPSSPSSEPDTDTTSETDPSQESWSNPAPPNALLTRSKLLNLDDISTATNLRDDPKFYTVRQTVESLMRAKELNPYWVPISDMRVITFQKLVVNACIGPLTSLLACSNGSLYANSYASSIIRDICTESAAVFAAQAQAEAAAAASSPPLSGIPTLVPPTAESLENHVFRVIQQTSANYSSMYHDVRSGAQTEIASTNGYISKLGQELGVKTPVTTALANLVRLRTFLPLEKRDPL